MPRSDASSVVTTYVKAWTSGDFDTARSTLRDDVAFAGPLGTPTASTNACVGSRA
jgi:hypothetical protein